MLHCHGADEEEEQHRKGADEGSVYLLSRNTKKERNRSVQAVGLNLTDQDGGSPPQSEKPPNAMNPDNRLN